jgi:hypothetical protein
MAQSVLLVSANGFTTSPSSSVDVKKWIVWPQDGAGAATLILVIAWHFM